MNEKVNLHEGHRARMRKRFRETGFDGFTEHEILEMILFYTCPRKDTNELAHILINKFGNFAGVIEAEYDDLLSIKNITENTATLFKMIPKILPVYYNSRSDGVIFDSMDKITQMFEAYFVGLTHEEFRIACFDNNLRMLSNILISSGTPTSSDVNMRTIVKEVMRTNAASAIICHNHPRCDTLASPEDREATKNISLVLHKLDVQLTDHLIVTEGRTISLRQMGYVNLFY